MKNTTELHAKHGHLFNGSHDANFTETAEFLEDFKTVIAALEKSLGRAEILEHIRKIRQLASSSIFINRAQIWPRGYQGDFETITYLLEGINHTNKSTPAFYMEDFFLRSEICSQHKNKISHQATMISLAIDKNPAAKMISIGCGTSEDMFLNIEKIRNNPVEITLVDIDGDALKYSMERLADAKNNITVVKGNIYKIVRSLKLKYDLVLIGGVFDYLNDKTIVAALKSLQSNMTTDGQLFFTNIARKNPYRIYMEYLSNWLLIERSREEMLRLFNESGWIRGSETITRDKTGLSFLVTLSNEKQIELSKSNRVARSTLASQ